MGTNNTQLITQVHNGLAEALESQKEALPLGFNTKRFLQNAVFLIRDGKSDFSKCEPVSIVRTLMKASFLGLDPMNGECYAIPYGNQCQFQTDYKGEVKLCKKYSIREVQDIYSKVVRKGDDFVEKIVDGRQTIEFSPLPFNGNEIVGAFAVVLYKDGGMSYEVMSKADIESVRTNYSKAKDSSAWRNSYDEMCKKTVLRRLCKHIELDFENAEMQRLFEETSDFDVHKKPDKPVVPNVFGNEEEVVEVEYTEVEEIDTSDLPFA